MKFKTALLTALMMAALHQAVAQTASPGVRPLRNEDVLRLVREKTPPEAVVRTINSSPCAFDTFPPVLKAMRMRGVPEAVLDAMRTAPYGLPREEAGGPRPAAPAPPAMSLVTIPAGTAVEIEVPYTVSSAEVSEGSRIPLRVARRLIVGGATVIPLDASVTARVVTAKGGGRWGRAGQLRWSVDGVTAADGSRVPLRFEETLKGENKGGTVTAGAAGTAVVVGASLPPAAPVAILWGLLKGEDVSVPSGRRLTAVVEGDVQVRAHRPPAKLEALRDQRTLKALNEQPPADLVRLKVESILRRW